MKRGEGGGEGMGAGVYGPPMMSVASRVILLSTELTKLKRPMRGNGADINADLHDNALHFKMKVLLFM